MRFPRLFAVSLKVCVTHTNMHLCASLRGRECCKTGEIVTLSKWEITLSVCFDIAELHLCVYTRARVCVRESELNVC